MTPTIQLKPGKEKRVYTLHPWIFKSDIDKALDGFRDNLKETAAELKARAGGRIFVQTLPSITRRMGCPAVPDGSPSSEDFLRSAPSPITQA